MHCDLQPEALGSYLDGELPVEEMTRVRAHIAGCSQCAAEIADLAVLKRNLRSVHGQFAPSPEFRQRVRAQITPKPSKWRFMAFAPYLATVGAMAIVLFVVTTWVTHSRRSDSLTEVADLHVSALASSHPLDVVSSDHHTVKPWFQGKIPFTFNIPDFSGTDFSLLGGRVAYFEQEPGAQLIVGLRKHEMSVLVFRAKSISHAALPVSEIFVERDGFHIETWQQKDLRFIVISDADPTAVGQLSQAMRKVN